FIDAHTDSIGSVQYNKVLAMTRAKLLSDSIIQKYPSMKGNIKLRSFDKSKPIATNTTIEGRALNRRAELYLKMDE
ncbi:MAG: OmpA family protein, partial [Bacteroidales bacterium]